MATLESDKVEKALGGKMKAEREDSGDWYFYIKMRRALKLLRQAYPKVQRNLE